MIENIMVVVIACYVSFLGFYWGHQETGGWKWVFVGNGWLLLALSVILVLKIYGVI